MPNTTFRLAGALLLALALALGACGPATPPPTTPDRITVIASFYPLYEFTRRVGGDQVNVRSLVPTGVEPHDWEPSPRDLADLSQADVFVYNGAGLEPWVDRVLREVGADIPVVVSATEGIDLLTTKASEKEQSLVDPHVWLDPVLAQDLVQAIAGALQKADPAHTDTYASNADEFILQLEVLHQRYLDGLEDCESQTLVTTHASFSYLASRFGLTQLAVSGLSPQVEPSPGRLAKLAEQAQTLGVTTIFFESLVSPAVAETLASEIGAQSLALNPLEGLTPEQEAAGEDYLTLMEGNLANLRAGLRCR